MEPITCLSDVMQSLALAHMDVADDVVSLTEWTETDFRTGGEFLDCFVTCLALVVLCALLLPLV